MPYWHRGILSRYESLHALAEYKVYLQALENGPIAARSIGIVLTARGGRQITSQELADRLLWRLTQQRGGFEFAPTDFDMLFEQFEADLRIDSIDYVAVAPLPGFKSDVPSIPLGQGFELAEFNDDEIGKCLRLSIYPAVDMGGVIGATNIYGLRYRSSERKFLGEVPLDEIERARGLYQELLDSLSRVVHTLRLLKRGTVSIPGVAIFTDHWTGQGGISGSPIDPGSSRANNYELTPVERESFEELWRTLSGPPLPHFLDTAIRRFGYAGERRRPEDRLVDLLIFAESLFLSDTGEASERGELRYRLALRAAYFVEIDGCSRRDVFRIMRNAYDARSAVVHGDLPRDKVLKVPQEVKVSLAQFVDFTEDVLRCALLKAVKIKPIDENGLADWDSLILG